jgi:hypothetical protein
LEIAALPVPDVMNRRANEIGGQLLGRVEWLPRMTAEELGPDLLTKVVGVERV